MSSTLKAVTVATALVGNYVPPQLAYPPAPDMPVVPRWQLATPTNNLKLKSLTANDKYRAMRSPESCYYPFEVLIIQDSTASFGDDYPVMIGSELDQMYDGITELHPNSTFAVVTHTDKPIKKFGFPATGGTIGDWCWRMEQSLSPNKADLKATYSKFKATGGYDYPENQYGALVNACQSKKLGWGTHPNAQRLIVISTDSPPHYDGDGNSRQGMAPFSGVFDEDNAAAQCTAEFYPTPAQVIDTVMNTSSGQIPPYVAFIVYDGGELPKNQTIESWRWFAGQIREDDRFVRDRTSNSDNFWEQLSKIIGVIDTIECQGSSSTTSTPTETTVSSTATTSSPSSVSTTVSTTFSSTDSTSVGPPHTMQSSSSESSFSMTSHTNPCPCPNPCPEPCTCKCGDSVYLRYPKKAKSVDLHIDYSRV